MASKAGMTMQGLAAMAFGILTIIIALTIIPAIGSEMDQAVTIPSNSYATGTITFSGNVSNGELVNITYGSAVYNFEFNTTGIAGSSPWKCVTTNCILVNVSIPWNTSVRASGNLTAAINANASTSAIVTAVNTTNTTTLTAVTIGTTGNAIELSENGVNTAVSGTTLTGGADGSQWNSNVNPNIPTAVDFWESVGGIFVVCGFIIVVVGFIRTLQGLRS